MTNKKSTRRIYNPVTRKYYAVRMKARGSSRVGQIKGLWSPKRSTKKTR